MLINHMLDILLICIMHGETDMINITLFVDYDKIVFDDVTVGWCVAYKSNHIMTLHGISMLDMF